MNQPAAYTPLESLFLFQSLLSHGVDGGAFARISELLKGNALIKSGDTYDAARLSPEALQQLFLRLLRDEIKGEAEGADGEGGPAGGGGGGGGGGGSDGSRKRKLSSPPLPTLKEVYENVDKIPILVDRLYARYRDHTVGMIREDERKFAMLQREIQLLERSEKERLAKVAASQNVTPTLAPRDPRTATSTTTTPAAAAVQPQVPPSNGATPSPGQTPATPAGIRKGPTPNTHVPPPKPPMSGIAAPKVAPPSQLVPGTPPPRTSALPKPPNGTSSVLQAPPGAPTQSTAQVLQPPPAQQPPKQIISPRPETAIPQPLQPQAAPGPAAPGSLKWEKPYQPPQTAQAPSTEQVSPPVPPSANNVALQKPPQPQPPQQQQTSPTPPPPQQQQQQQQWQRQPVPHPQHPTPQQPQQPHTQYPPQPPQPPHGQVAPSSQQQQARPTPAKPVLVHPQSVGQLVAPLQPGPPRPVGPGAVPQQVRPPSLTPSTTPSATPGRPIQPQQQQQVHPQQQQAQQVQQTTPQHQHIQRTLPAQTSLLAQKFQSRGQNQRPIASATTPKGTPSVSAGGSPIPNKAAPGAIATPRWQPGASSAQQGARAATSASPVPKDKTFNSTNAAQAPSAIPEHMIRQVAATPPVRRPSPASPMPRTPAPSSPVSLKRGFGTKWASQSTPSTPGPITSEPESPAYEPVSPPIPRPVVGKDSAKAVPKLAVPKMSPKIEATPPAKAPRGRPPRSIQKGRGASATPSATGTRRSQSVVSQTDELSLDHSVTKVKKEAAATPRLREETGDTTADESMPGRGLLATPNSMARASKRKRQDTPTDLQGPPTHVLWTRGFTKVSSSALDQISSHRDANMFATALREKDAPNYRQIVLQPQDITSIRSAIKAGNKAALQAAANLPGGDPGTASVWLPISDDLVPPRGIINSAHLERELVHMFCNAIMYNPDPDRGPGPAFMRRSQNDEEEIVGYRLDENGVVKNTQSMFLEVEKLLGDLRAAEKDRGIPPISTTRQGSVATPAEDTAEEEDELAGDGDSASASGTAKRRRISTRS